MVFVWVGGKNHVCLMLHRQMSKVVLWSQGLHNTLLKFKWKFLSIKASAGETRMAVFIPGLCQQMTFKTALNFRKGQSGADREVYQQNVSIPHTKPYSRTLKSMLVCVQDSLPVLSGASGTSLFSTLWQRIPTSSL